MQSVKQRVWHAPLASLRAPAEVSRPARMPEFNWPGVLHRTTFIMTSSRTNNEQATGEKRTRLPPLSRPRHHHRSCVSSFPQARAATSCHVLARALAHANNIFIFACKRARRSSQALSWKSYSYLKMVFNGCCWRSAPAGVKQNACAQVGTYARQNRARASIRAARRSRTHTHPTKCRLI